MAKLSQINNTLLNELNEFEESNQATELKNVVRDVVAGTIGGWGQTLAGQPFDTIKVRMQTATSGRRSMTECITSLVRNEGPLALYKGTLSPLLGAGFSVSIQFACLQKMKRLFNESPNSPLNAPQQLVCSSAAGLAQAFITSPVEHIRTRLQVQGNSGPRFSGPADCIRQIVRMRGVRGIFHGLGATLVRDVPAFGAYFGSYEILKQRVIPAGGSTKDLAAWQIIMMGGISGLAYWIPIYHIDVLKSKIQTQDLLNPQYKHLLDCYRQTVRAGGVRSLYAGMLPCLLRAIPANAATFFFFELAMRSMGA